MADNRAVMNQEAVRDAAEAFEGFVFVNANGFIAQIAAGGDDGKAEVNQQEIVQRVGGEEDAQIGVAGGDAVGQRTFGGGPFRGPEPAQEHQGRGGRTEQPGFQRGHLTDGAHLVERGKHQGQGLLLAVLARA